MSFCLCFFFFSCAVPFLFILLASAHPSLFLHVFLSLFSYSFIVSFLSSSTSFPFSSFYLFFLPQSFVPCLFFFLHSFCLYILSFLLSDSFCPFICPSSHVCFPILAFVHFSLPFLWPSCVSLSISKIPFLLALCM